MHLIDHYATAGVLVTKTTHECKTSGVQGSHCFWKLPYWDEVLVSSFHWDTWIYVLKYCRAQHCLLYSKRTIDYFCHSSLQMRGPDSMHTVAGDVKAIFSMLIPVASPFDGNQGETNYRIEVELNDGVVDFLHQQMLVEPRVLQQHRSDFRMPKCVACKQ